MVGMVLAAARARVKRALAVVTPGPEFRNSVLLTFDDGPHPEVTPAVLDLLDTVQARAAFFIVGSRIRRAPHLLAEILRRGHVIGNHSYSHDAALGFSAQLQDLRRCQGEIERLTGCSPRLLRPPAGKLTLPILLAAAKLRLRIVLWSLDSGDWRIRSPEAGRARGAELAANLLSRGRLSEIILLHDDNPNTVALLEGLLPALKQSGCDRSRAWQALCPGHAG